MRLCNKMILKQQQQQQQQQPQLLSRINYLLNDFNLLSKQQPTLLQASHLLRFD